MAGQDGSGQVIESAAAVFATVTLAVALGLIMAIATHRTTRTTRTLDAVWPTMLTDHFIAFFVIKERGEVDQLRDSHSDTESVEN